MLLMVMCGVVACSTTVGSSSPDASRDVASDLGTMREDRSEVAVQPDGFNDAMEVVDRPEGEEVTDVNPLADAPEGCEQDPPSGPPLGTNRSCGDGGAPAWHCREVHYCGGSYTMGAVGATEVGLPQPPQFPRYFPMRDCDVHSAVVHPGYVDAYEVTVARFRVWVHAGMPPPPAGADIFNGLRWTITEKRFTLPTSVNSVDQVPGFPATDSMCTYRDVPGPNDNLPVNCVSGNVALAFCWWDGKHLATEVAWEYLARNRGTTPTPFGPLPSEAERCRYGDVGAYNNLCPREALPQPVDAFPLGATRDPAGIFGLYGGLMERVIGIQRPYNSPPALQCQSAFTPTSYEGRGATSSVVRGTAWFQSREDQLVFSHSASRGAPVLPDGNLQPFSDYARSPREGIRCMRWTPEPRGP